MRNLWQCVPVYHSLLLTAAANNAAGSSLRNIICHTVRVSGHNTTCGIKHRLITRHEGCAVFFSTLNRWHFRVKEQWIKKTHLCFIQQDSPLRGFLSVSSLLINSLSPILLSLSLSLSPARCLMNAHTHTPTQAVRNHKTCCLLSCSDDNLLATRGKCFSQPIIKLIRQCGKVSCQGFWGSRQKYQRENNTGSGQVFGTHPHLNF